MRITQHQSDLLRTAWGLIEAAAVTDEDAKALRVAMRRERGEFRGLVQRADNARMECVAAWMNGWDWHADPGILSPNYIATMRPGLLAAKFAGVRMRHWGGKTAQAAYDAAVAAFTSKEATQ